MKTYRFLILNIIMCFLSFGCKKADNETLKVENLDSFLKALSSKRMVNDVTTMSYKVVGAAYEWDEPSVLYVNPINTNNYTYLVKSNLDNRQVSAQFTQFEIKQPFSYQTGGINIVINDKEGMISGEYDFKSYFLNMRYPQSLNASRIEAMIKNCQMTNPLFLAKLALQNNVKEIKDNRISIPTIVQGLYYVVEFDPISNLPLNCTIKESDFLKGDIEYKIQYSDWRDIDGFNVPTKFHYYLGGRMFRSEQISDISINPIFPKDIFKISGIQSPVPYDTPNGWMGFIYSQWYNRWFDKGLLFDQPLNNGAWILEDHDLTPYGLPNQTVGEHIKIIGRPDHSLYSVAIKTSKGIFLFEPTLNNFWTRSVLNATKSKFPGQKISGVIVSHTHSAIASGVREAAYETQNVIIGKNGKSVIDEALANEHHLNPDALALNPIPINVNEVGGKTILAEGELEIYYLGGDTADLGRHANDMVIAYIPSYQTVIQSELMWNGPFKRVFVGQAANSYSDASKQELKRRAQFLDKSIKKYNLKVKRIISVQGGLGSYDDLINVINN